jgi:hypothetical protein
MSRSLSELDRIFASLEKELSSMEKLKYCVNLIETTDVYLSNNHSILTPKMIAESRELIEAAQLEIMKSLGKKLKYTSRYKDKMK